MIKQKMTKEKFHSIELPGVTKVLDEIFGHDEFKGIPDTVMKAAAERGSAVHEWIETFITTGEKKPIEIAYQVYIDYFLEWYNEYKPDFVFSEQMLINKKDGYKGIIDTVFYYEKEGKKILCMCDWKTSSSLNRFKTMCQLNLYARMFKKNYPKENDIDEIRTLSITKTGWRFSKFELSNKIQNEILHLWRLKNEYNK